MGSRVCASDSVSCPSLIPSSLQPAHPLSSTYPCIILPTARPTPSLQPSTHVPSIHLCTHLSCPSSAASFLHPSTHLHPSIYRPTHLSRHLSIHPAAGAPPQSTPTYLIHPSTHPILSWTFVRCSRTTPYNFLPAIHLPSVYPCIPLSTYPPIHLSSRPAAATPRLLEEAEG